MASRRIAGSLLALAFATLLFCPAAFAAGPEGALDARGWELVSPSEKNGGEVEAPGSDGGAVFQAAGDGGAFAFGSTSSFANPLGAAPVSQYLAARNASGWATQNLTPPQLSDTYAAGAYQAFSADLSSAILTSGWHCRGGAASCEGENPPLGAGAPVGYRNLYLRKGGTYLPVLTTANTPSLSVSPEAFQLALEGATDDLGQIAISTCAALTSAASEVPVGEGCLETAPNLYLYSGGALKTINLLPGEPQSSPGATLAASVGAISTSGSRVYWQYAEDLYLREGSASFKVADDAIFQDAGADGSLAYFTSAGHLYRYSAASKDATDLTPAGEVLGVLGASADGSRVYYLTALGLFTQQGATATKFAPEADASNYPPATGTARLSTDGDKLAFISSASLTGYSNVGKTEVFVYDAGAKKLLCASCNPKGSTPVGPSSIPGASQAGEGPFNYKPRALSADGDSLFFDSADRVLSALDTDKAPDVYQWSAPGASGCAKAAGCLGLVSSGRIGSGAFLDASADGGDAYFLTATSLLSADGGGLDVYDARAAAGFPEPEPQIPCVGDECQGPPPGPDDPAPGTSLLEGPHNPPLRFAKDGKKRNGVKSRDKKKRHHKKKGKAAKRHRGHGR